MLTLLPAGVKGKANISNCKNYRYSLSRRWEKQGRELGVIMLNPSMADAEYDDPTVRRLYGLARANNFGAFTVMNLFAYRATDPAGLKTYGFKQARGGRNMMFLDVMRESEMLVAFAWGAVTGKPLEVAKEVIDFMVSKDRPFVYCFGTTAAGHPRHPLYLPAKTTLRQYNIT